MGSIGVLKHTTMICAPLMGHSVEQMVGDMYKAKEEGADIVEVRLDGVKNLRPKEDLEVILKNKPLPVIIVCR